MLTGALKVWLLAAVVGGLAISGVFYLRQRSGERIGGAIAPAKALWLTFAVVVWFFVTPIVAADPAVAWPLRLSLGLFAASMWVRGLAELALMYGSKGWKPAYGIAHDLFSLALLGGALAVQAGALAELTSSLDRWVLAYAGVLWVSMVLETVYAVLFRQVVGDAGAQGDDAVWFANTDDSRYATSVRITALANVPLYGFMAAFVGVCVWGG